MHTKTLTTLAAISLALTVGPAMAGEKFSTLGGVNAVAMKTIEADAVRGKSSIVVNGNGLVNNAAIKSGGVKWNGKVIIVVKGGKNIKLQF